MARVRLRNTLQATDDGRRLAQEVDRGFLDLSSLLTTAENGIDSLRAVAAGLAVATPYINVRAAPYRAKGTGLVDDAPAIRRALSVASERVSSGEGSVVVYIPAGTYRLDTVEGSYDAFFEIPTGVTVMGDGDATVLKAADGLNTSDEFRFFAAATANRVRITNLRFDCNGSNNAVPSGTPGKGNQAVYILTGQDITVDHVSIIDNPGRQGLHFGNNTNPQTVRDLLVHDVRIRNVGTAVSGNTHQTDHSCLYVQARDFEVSRVICRNDTMAAESTAFEIHGSQGSVSGCVASLFGTGFNIVATVTDHVQVHYSDLQVVQCQRPIRFWCWSGFTMGRLKISGSTFLQHSGALEPLMNLNSQVQSGSDFTDVTFSDCHFESEVTDYTRSLHAITVGRQQRVVVRDCYFKSIAGRAVSIGNILDGILDLEIRDCYMLDCGLDAGTMTERAFVALNSLDNVGRLRVTGNTMRGSVVGTANTVTGSATLSSVSNVSDWSVGDPINGSRIPDGATVTAVDTGASELTISANATATDSVKIFRHGRYGLTGNAAIDYGSVADNDIDRNTFGTDGIGAAIDLTGTADTLRMQTYEYAATASPNGVAVGNPQADNSLSIVGQSGGVAQFLVWMGGAIVNFFLWTSTQLQIATANVVRLVVDADQFNPNTTNAMRNGLDGRRWLSTYTNGLAVAYGTATAPNDDDCYIERAGGGSNVQLPEAADATGRVYFIEVTGSGSITVLRDSVAGDTINGSAADYTASVGLHMVVANSAGTGWRAVPVFRRARSGAGSPNSVATPEYIGQEYLDTTGPTWYKASGLTDTDWDALN